jgi:predicted metalloendopeptidase
MFQLLGEPEEAAKKHAGQVFNFELELAKVSRPRVEMRDPNKTYNKLDLDGLKKLAPALDWTRFLATTGYPSVKDINVSVPEFFQGLEKQVTSTDPETLRAYLRWHLLRATSPLLSKAFVDESFEFYGKKLSGQKEQQARWKRCVEATDQSLGELLGPEFVKLYFPGDSKAIAKDLIGRIEAAFEKNLPSLTWMDDATRGRADGKLKALKNKIGYPDKWRDYSKLAVMKGEYFGNGMAARRFAFDYDANKIGKPVDKGDWGMTPPTVNAYYNANLNEMVFPAGILQPPFFDRNFPMAMNFGGIGMVMGHELTHGFDDQGRKFDPTGKLTEWWEPSVSAKFEERAKCVSDLYSTYEVQPGVTLNGKLTLGENIADLGGIKQAYVAYKKWAAEHPELDKPAVPGLTNDQLFFVGFGQTWCTIQTPESERMLVTTDPHSHAKYRVTGPLSNSPAFSSAFQCAEGTPMHRKDACEVW